MGFIWYIPDAVPSGLPTDESELLNALFWKSKTWEKIPEVYCAMMDQLGLKGLDG